MNWIEITPDTELNYIDTYLFRYPKGDGVYVVGGLVDNGKRLLHVSDETVPEQLDWYTHYCVITPPKD